MVYELDPLRKVLGPSIKINTIRLSYVARIFPEYKDSPCVILYKEQLTDFVDDHSERADADQTYQFDITGSPLKYSFHDGDDFEDSIILMKQNWSEKEEKYLPLSRTEACNALNACIEFITDDFPPIFALCNGRDKKESRLLGTVVKEKWFTTIEVCSAGFETFHGIKDASTIIQEHLNLSHVHEYDVTISAFNTFDLFGTKAEMINWKEFAKCNFEGSISVEVNAHSLSLHPPARATNNNLVGLLLHARVGQNIAQIVTGSINSPLKELWKQLLLLNQYLNVIEEYKRNISSRCTLSPLEFPHDFSSPYKEISSCLKQEYDIVRKNINLLLNGDYSFKSPRDNELRAMDLNEENFENDIKIEEYIKNLPCRYNLDFTDFLWELLIQNSNYFEMTECIHTVLQEILINDYLVQVNSKNPTRFAKIISGTHYQKLISHLLSGSLPLEYVIDIGFEKLCRDYVYVLMSARFSELPDIQQKLENVSSGEFTVDSYRRKLIRMAQIHACLEFMLLLQDNLECSADDLRSIFLSTFKQYVCEESPIQNYLDLHENAIYNLTVPLPIAVINTLNKEVPTTRRISLSSESKLSRLTTVKYYSQMPIFPTSIYPLDNSSVTEEAYYVTSATCSSNKYK